MHMADALISPAVGGTMWAVSAGLLAYAAHKVKTELDESRVPLMAVMAAFVFAAQMINFTIPATGSSGHLGGALMLAILLGPYAGFLALASVVTIQAFFFADGGLLALGCNIFNMGFWGCFVAYPLIYRPIVGAKPTRGRILVGSILAAIVGLQLGPFSVVLQTLASGISELPFSTFVLLMQPIHLAIGLVEGLVTATVVIFVWQARPELFAADSAASSGAARLKPVIIGLAVAAALTAGVLSWFASANPDGLEWSMFKTSGHEELEAPAAGAHADLAAVQQKSAFLPDYGFKQSASAPAAEETEAWPAVNVGTSVAGLVGGAIVLLLAGLIGFGLKRFNRGTPA